MLLNNVGRSHVRLRARSRGKSHDHKSCDHTVTIAFLLGVSSNKRIIVKSYLELGKKPPNSTGEKGGKPVFL